MKSLLILLVIATSIVAMPQRNNGRPGNGRPGGNRPRPNKPPSNSQPNETLPPTNTNLPNGGNNNAGNNNNGGGNVGSIDPSLIPDFGITAGIPSTNQPGSCQGNNNVNIPCKCPPSKADFISVVEKFNAQGNIFGSPFSFDTNTADQSAATRLSRVTAATIALQNFDQTKKGEGCPAGGSAPNFLRIQAQLQTEV